MIFALLVPVILAISGVVIGLGNWFVHAKHLQTKADAGAIAGGGAFQFPCFAGVDTIDQGIADIARQYAGPTSAPPVASPGTGFNPQVGGVVTDDVHAVLNGPDWYDDDENPAPTENLDICDGSVGPNDPMRLEVKVTEDNSFPLASLIPLFPDIKRKATVELFQTDGVGGMLPIAVRAPEPQSALAIFYDESSGAILDRKYFLKKTGPGLPGLPGLPPAAGLQGWSTEVANLDPENWASVNVGPRTGVVVAISYRGACNTWGGTAPTSAPPGLFLEPTGKCLEDGIGTGAPSYTQMTQICNQGGTTQVANCYYTTDPNPQVPNDEIVQSGLQFIRGYSSSGPVPHLADAHLSTGSCGSGYGSAYFYAFPNVCSAGMNASIDVGSCFRIPDPDPNPPDNWTGPCVPSSTPGATETRIADNVEVKYTLVYGTGNNDHICDFGPTCDLADSGSTNNLSATGLLDTSPQANQTRYAVALRVRMKDTVAPGPRDCTSDDQFAGSCEWYIIGTQTVDTQPPDATIFANPVQRIFHGNSVTAGSIRWLNLKADRNACGSPPVNEAVLGSEGSVQIGTSCFVVEMGLKGGLASDADDAAILFNDGIGASQLGYLDCTQTGPQNLVWELMNGCPPLYGPHNFNTDPLCPPAGSLFTTPDPGPPWDPASAQIVWPPIRCVKTRPTSQGIDLIKGLNGRFFFPNDPNPSPNPPNTCPAQVGTGYVQGRNYWKWNGSTPYGYREDDGSHQTNFAPNDTRKVVIFLTTPESFAGSGQNTYPITGAIGVYITGFGRVGGSGSVVVDDPCAGPLPGDLDLSGGSVGGHVIWGHFINTTVLSAAATSSGVACNPGGSTQPCVPVLVE